MTLRVRITKKFNDEFKTHPMNRDHLLHKIFMLAKITMIQAINKKNITIACIYT
jgi:hypothetical protein